MIPSDEVRTWIDLARDDRVGEVFRLIFEESAETVRRERPLCLASGRCCHFEAHGHRLYVTGLEAAWFIDQLAERTNRLTIPMVEEARRRGDCPMLEDGLCTVHDIRPFGCRSYFCDPRAGWQEAAYERWHARVRALHEELDVPYAYGEWRDMLTRILEFDGEP
ncbi:MAG: hypothetical protein MK082_10795 [Phycisphaerales bacterium]|nr:hypothetical protein [Phycisphaerales bacterium]